MATSNLNSLILATARKLKDARTNPSSVGDTGRVYSSAVLTDYANRAVRDFLRDALKSLGPKLFAETFPEYIKTSSTLTLAAGSVAKPTDALFVIGLMKSDLTLNFEPVKAEELASVLTGAAGLLNASATQPLFYDEAGNIKTLGVTTGDVIARYIRVHPDLTVITTAVGNGTIYTTAANITWTAATKLLTIDDDPFFSGDQTNRLIMFRTATIVYVGRIQSQTVDLSANTLVTIDGDGLPAGNISAPNIIEMVVSGLWPDGSDLKLNAIWYGEIVERMTAMAEADAVRILQQK